MHNFGWLNQKGGENRLNVAISRARKKIHIVTSFRPGELSLDDAKNEGPVILKRYLEYAFAISDGDTALTQQILHSFGETYGIMPAAVETAFAQKVADALRAKGYEIDTQVGIGGHRIDIAMKKDGKYILVIQCDGKRYSISRTASSTAFRARQESGITIARSIWNRADGTSSASGAWIGGATQSMRSTASVP